MTDSSDKTDRIRYLNDLTRSQPAIANATWLVTPGVTQLLVGDPEPGQPLPDQSSERVAQLRRAIATYSSFPQGDDPYKEHDFGTLHLFGAKLYWKIDYYHPDHDRHAPDPASIELCRRVLTIMLAEEY